MVYYATVTFQSSHCQLQASEDGTWPVTTLDFIHTTIVEKQCQVTLKQEPKAGQPLVVSELFMQYVVSLVASLSPCILYVA